MSPRDHRIHLGRRDCPKTSPQHDVLTKVCFSGPHNLPKKVPGPKSQPRVPKFQRAAQQMTPGRDNTKDARRNSVQRPASNNSNRAMRCESRPNTILGGGDSFPFFRSMEGESCVRYTQIHKFHKHGLQGRLPNQPTPAHGARVVGCERPLGMDMTPA